MEEYQTHKQIKIKYIITPYNTECLLKNYIIKN